MKKMFYNIAYILIVLFNVKLLIATFNYGIICYILIMLLFSIMLTALNEVTDYLNKKQNKRK